MGREQAGRPRTLVAQWLRAAVLSQTSLYKWLSDDIDRLKWEQNPEQALADITVLVEAFRIIVRRRFVADVDVRVITAWVFEVHERANHVPVLTGEAMVRQALGEQIEIKDNKLANVLSVAAALFSRAYTELYKDPVRGPDEAALDEILTEAEHLAEAQGHHPAYIRAAADQ